MRVDVTRFAPSQSIDVANGLLGWVELVINESIVIERVRVRRALNDCVCLSLPTSSDRRGRTRHPVRPRDDKARLDLERQVVEALLAQGVAL